MSCAAHESALRQHAAGGPLDLSLERHLAECASCREALLAEQRVQSGIDVALDVLRHTEPSPAFLARARAQVDGPRPSLGWLVRPRWIPLLGMLAAALVVAFGVMVAPTRPAGQPPLASGPMAQAPASPAPTERAATLPEAPTARAAAAPTTRAPRPLPTPPKPLEPALVPPGQEETLARFAALLANGGVAPPALLVEPSDPARELASPPDLNLRALAIEPMAAEGADTEGDTL